MKISQLIDKVNRIPHIRAEYDAKKNEISFHEYGNPNPFYSFYASKTYWTDGQTCFCNINAIFMSEILQLVKILEEFGATPVEERKNAEKRYYLWFLDFDNKKTYFEFKDIVRYSKHEFVAHNWESEAKIETDMQKFARGYQLTKEQILELPKEWWPSEFGGLGLTKLTPVIE